jgi:acetylornithine/N-succinyldiaminopimelate aminotransferase
MHLRQLFLQHLAPTSDAPLLLEIERAEGIYMYGPDGKRYADLISGIGVSHLGHRHPKVVEAIVQQVTQSYMHLMVYGEYVQSPQVKLAEKLTSLLPENLDSVYFINSGAEATEGAMKLAKRITGRSGFVSCINSYHGSTQGALSLMGDDFFKNKYKPLLPNVTHIRYNHQADLQNITNETAAVFIEAVQAEAGIIIGDKNYLQAVRKRCDETGALMVLDEIQTGMGRTGSLFAFQQFDFVPDILLLGKAFGAGMPLAAFVSSRKNMQTLSVDPALGHITTFGGHPVCCAAALAGLNALVGEDNGRDAMHRVSTSEKKFRDCLKHKWIKELRSRGLMMAIEFESAEVCKRIIDNCIENGVVVDWFLFAPHCMRIAPPLIISDAQIEESCDVILQAIDHVAH